MTRTNVLSTSQDHPSRSPQVVLVHGALTDASVWADVAPILQSGGIQVTAPALPLRGLDSDARYLAGVIERLNAPVVLVGHSYAGAVISHPAVAATGSVAALVFVSAFQPDTGEAAGELNERFPGTLLTPENLVVASNPLGGDDLTLAPDRFAEVYAGDVEPARAAWMAASQRPIDPAALGEPLPGQPGWRSIPSWATVTTEDRSLPPQVLRFMAERAGSETVEIDSAHAVPVAQPQAVADLISAAVSSTLN